MKTRIPLWLALASLPAIAQAEASWADLPRVLAVATFVSAYVAAARAIVWLLIGTAVAWAFHLYYGRARGLTTSELKPLPSYPRPRELDKLRWLLPSFHVALTILTVAALLTLGIGSSMGLKIDAARAEPTIPAVPQRPRDPFEESWRNYSPNGKPWPTSAAYLPGMPLLAQGGLGDIYIDNSAGGSALHVKLCAAADGPCAGMRHAYVPKGQSMAMNDVAPGTYELRYRDLNLGMAQHSKPFTFDAAVRASRVFKPGDLRSSDDFDRVSARDY